MKNKCITFEQEKVIKQAIDNGNFDIDEIANMSTKDRREAFKPFVDANMMDKFSKGFEERIIISSKNHAEKMAGKTAEEITIVENKIAIRQKKLLNKYVLGDPKKPEKVPTKQKNVIDRVNKLEHMLLPQEGKIFLEDLVRMRLGVGITRETAEELGKLSVKATEARNALKVSLGKIKKIATEKFMTRPEIIDKKKLMKIDANGADTTGIKLDIEQDMDIFVKDVFNGAKDLSGKRLNRKEYDTVMKERLALSANISELENFMGDLYRGIEVPSIKDIKNAEGAYAKFQASSRFAGQVLYESFALGKSMKASLDFSYIFRQGWQTALTDPRLLAKNANRAVFDAWKTLRYAKRQVVEGDNIFQKFTRQFDNNVYDFARLEINSRANALNGMYDVSSNGYGLNVYKEEAFPSSIAERIPVFGRAFKVSEVAYNALALRMRADLADAFIFQMEKAGLDMRDKKVADELSLLVGSMTGRGLPFGVKFLENASPGVNNALNVTFFSPRFLGSQIYTLLTPFAMLKDFKNPIVKLRAAKAGQAVAELAAFVLLINLTSEMFGNGEVVDTNIKSSNFGKARIGDFAFDLTGAHASILTLGGKLWEQRQSGMIYDPKLGIYKKAPWTESSVNLLTTFILNKTSPTASIMKDVINGYQFGGDDLTWASTARNLMLPLTLEISWDTITNDSSLVEALLVMTGELVGVNSKDMRINPMSADWKKLHKASPGKWKRAKAELNDQLFSDIKELRNDSTFQELTREEQDKEIMKRAKRQRKTTVQKALSDIGL